MYTLYYSPGACSLSVHIALCENELPFDLKKVDLKTKQVADQGNFDAINPKSYVPTLIVEDNKVLTECAAILMYVAHNGKKTPAPSPNSFAFYRLMEGLVFVSSELHKLIGTFFNPALSGEYKNKVVEKIRKRFDMMEEYLGRHEYITGEEYTVADSYCFAILRWLNVLDTGINLEDWPRLYAYSEKVRQRPAVQRAMEEEGIKHR